jgi:hypothetical protein
VNGVNHAKTSDYIYIIIERDKATRHSKEWLSVKVHANGKSGPNKVLANYSNSCKPAMYSHKHLL